MGGAAGLVCETDAVTGSPPNVLLVIADTVRADHLDLYGYERKTTHHLSRTLAARDGWTIFDRCYSTAGWTLPACASIVTGQAPDRHGLVDHSRRFTTEKIAGALTATHRTVGIGNNGNLVSDDISVETLDALGLERRPKKWNHFGWNEGFDRYIWFPHDQHHRAINTACRLLDRWRDDPQPWFLMLHTNLAHDYNLDRPYYLATSRFLDRPLDERLHKFPDGPQVWNELGSEITNLAEQIVAKYDAGLRRLDRALDRVLRRVDLDETIVVIVSDHGEGFEPEHGRVHHCGRLHEDLLHVPLFFHTPPGSWSGDAPPRRLRRVRSVTDIVPTILRMTGASMSGRLDGRDLFGPERHRTIHAMDSAYLYRRDATSIRRLSSDQGPVEVRSVINHPLKVTTTTMETETRPSRQVNLGYDPRELEEPLGPAPAPIPAVTVVVDFDEYDHNLAASPDVRSGRLDLQVVDNRDNRAGEGIGGIYSTRTAHLEGPVVFVHPDVYLPEGWVDRLHRCLSDLDDRDPNWVVAGVAGRTRGSIDRGDTGRGHWSDPHGYRRFGPLPHPVDVVDEMVIVTRDRSVDFDPDHPGFHCYGTDVCATAQFAGRTVWVIDDFAWHKMRRPDRSLCDQPDASRKISGRQGEGFSDEFRLSADFVKRKWEGRHPLQGMTEYWRDFYGEG